MSTCTPVQVGFERILVPASFADAAQNAMGYAQAIARNYGSQIIVAHDDQALRASTAQRESADLIVLDARGRSGVSRLLFGSDAEDLYRTATCPILVVGPAAEPAPADSMPWRPRDIVCASNLDPDSVSAAAFASELAEEHGAALTVLHVEGTYEEKDREACLAKFKRAFSEFDPGHREPSYIWRTLLSVHTVGSTIADFASVRHSHLIVIGAQSAGSASSRFSTGIAPQILAKAPCPVMIVPGK